MKTNINMIRQLKEDNFTPQNFGVLAGDEVNYLKSVFELEKRTDVELQNLRDFVVIYFSHKTERPNMVDMDIMSGIVGVIDSEKIKRGLEV